MSAADEPSHAPSGLRLELTTQPHIITLLTSLKIFPRSQMDSPSVFWRVLVLVFLKVEGYQNFERLSQIFGFSKLHSQWVTLLGKGYGLGYESVD